MNNKKFLDMIKVTGKIQIDNVQEIIYKDIYNKLSDSDVDIQRIALKVLNKNDNISSIRFLHTLAAILNKFEDRGEIIKCYYEIGKIIDAYDKYRPKNTDDILTNINFTLNYTRNINTLEDFMEMIWDNKIVKVYQLKRVFITPEKTKCILIAKDEDSFSIYDEKNKLIQDNIRLIVLRDNKMISYDKYSLSIEERDKIIANANYDFAFIRSIFKDK